MTIADQITRLTNAKAAIKTSIENKGVTVSDDALLDEYPALIDSIEVGSGDSEETYENPDFYEFRTSGGTDYSYLFANTSFTTLDLNGWDTSNVTNMMYMFQACNKLTSLDLSGWDTSNVTSMYQMFYNCQLLSSIDLSNFNTSNVTNMGYMFRSCKSLTELDVSNFNTSNVTNMDAMFYETSLITLNISGWDTSNVTDFGNINTFVAGNLYDSATQQLKEIIGVIDLSSCTGGMAYSSTYYCFRNLPNLETLYLKNIYANSTMTNATKWGINLGDTIVKDECLIYIIDQLPDLINDKGLTSTSSIILTLPTTNTLTQEQVQVAIDKGWSVANTTY